MPASRSAVRALRAAAAAAEGAGRLYPAYETPEELEYKRKRQLARGGRRSTTAPRLRSPTADARGWRPKAASRTGASCSIRAESPGTIWCAGPGELQADH